MARILVADKISARGVQVLEEAGHQVDVKTGLKEEELVATIPEYEGVVVRSATKISAPVVEAGAKLRLIGRAGVGVDNIDIDAATARGIIVMNTPYGNITAAAEHSLALVLALARHVPSADASMKAKEWEKKKFTGVELSGKALGIVGLGKIGSIVAQVAHALSMRVLVNDPYLNPERAKKLDVELRELDALLKEADFVTLHVPLNESTRGLIGARELAMMKPTARLVNCSRGGVVDEAALADVLREGGIAGAALDVYSQEPLDPESPLRELPNLTLTPHLGASTAEAQEKVAEDLARQFADYFARGEIRNPVNLAVTLKPRMAPYAKLSELLATFAVQITPGAISRVECNCYGQIGQSAENAHVVAVFALQGVLGKRVDTRVNLVNVSRIAESRGIELGERRSGEAPMFRNLVEVKLQGESGERSVAGTLFEDHEPRIVRIDGFDIDLVPTQGMLLMTYPDQPGMVGKIGTILGQADINIAGMSVGRREKRGKAVVVLTVDDPVPDTVLQKVRRAIDAEEVHHIRL